MSTIELTAKKIPKSRLSRLTHFGKLVGGIGGNMLINGSKEWVQGKRPSSKDLLLTPRNIQKFADSLAQMRGAAMKVGQLLSMDTGDLMPEELTQILAKLRSEGKSMPLNQLVGVLEKDWGKDWQDQFQQFSFYPIAAASIGQVHEAHTLDGRHLALKIQYPGIKTTIDSDVDNLSSLLRLSGLVPKSVDLKPILNEAKSQLHSEANYEYEADCLNQYQQNLAGDERFLIPVHHFDLTSENILAMDFVHGEAIESRIHAPQQERDFIMHSLFELLFKEMFEFRLVQTDPNFANYQYNPDTKQIVLLDFGATRAYPHSISEGYYKLIGAAIKSDKTKMEAAARQIGFFSYDILEEQKIAVLELFHQAAEPMRFNGKFDFGATDLTAKIKDKGMALSMELDYWHTPPADALFFHRKLGGLFLLAAKLKAKVNLNEIYQQQVLSKE